MDEITKLAIDTDLTALQATLQTMGLTWGKNILLAVVIFYVGRWAARKISHVLKKIMRRSSVDETLVGFIGNIVNALIMTFVVIAALSKLGVETTSLAAIIAAAGLAIGLALQGSLSNFAAGVMLILFRPFKKGDYIEAGGTAGSVDEISIFTTTLKSPDNKVVIVPNANITGGTITNYSKETTRRLDLTFGVGYGDDIKKAKDVLEKILQQSPYVLKNPAYTVAVAELGASSVNIVVRPWVNTADYWNAHFEITEAVKNQFDAENISIPYPQQDVHMHQVVVAK